MIFLQIFIAISCGALNALGGYHWLFCRRYIMPFILAVGFSIVTHTWWVGSMVLPVMGTLCLGYFKIKNQFLSRGGWLALQAFVIGIGVFLTGHLPWFLYVPNVVLAFVAGGLLYNMKQIEGDVLFGIILALDIFCIH